MGLSATMWSSVSGLLMHGEKMNVVGNNLANVSTVGFKGQRMDFQDFVYQDSYSASGTTQIGRGVGIAAVLGDFSQGAFESTNDPTDLAIAGKGFFQVKDAYSDQVWYTRAGDFRFDSGGTLRSPQGQALQGWKIDNRDGPSIATGATPSSTKQSALRGTGSPQDIVFDTWTVAPKQTSKVTVQQGLQSKVSDLCENVDNPCFSLWSAWNGNKTVKDPSVPPIASSAVTSTATTQVFDEAGISHTLTTYFDQVSKDSTKFKNLPPNLTVYEYTVTMDPTEDLRTFGGVYDPATGQLKDDPTTYTAPSQTRSNTQVTAPAPVTPVGNSWSTGNRGIVATLADVNAALGLVAPNLLTDVGVLQYPSGGWQLDPSDPNVQKAIALDGDITITPAQQTAITALKKDLELANQPMPPAPADINKVRRFADTKAAGIVMTGTLVFDAAGNLVNQSAYTYKGGATGLANNQTLNADPSDLSNWEPTQISNNGLPVFTPNFSGMPMANSVGQKTESNKYNQKDASSYLIEFDLGLSNTGSVNNLWTNNKNAAQIGTDYLNLGQMTSSKKTDIPSTMKNKDNNSSNTVQNGYASGNLNNYNVDQDGVLYGIYSNGVTLPLYQIALYDFTNTQALRREGGNMFSATRESGNPRVSVAGQNGMGDINSQALEQSNVDMAREFVQMITTQRGFQANSKGITTVDSMLEVVIGMKR